MMLCLLMILMLKRLEIHVLTHRITSRVVRYNILPMVVCWWRTVSAVTSARVSKHGLTNNAIMRMGSRGPHS